MDALERLANMEVRAAHLRGIAKVTNDEFDLWLAITAESTVEMLRELLIGDEDNGT